jgi:hypothetical protein
MDVGGLFPVHKAAELEADYSPLSIAEVKNVWTCTSTLPCVFMVWYLVKHNENCTVLFLWA